MKSMNRFSGMLLGGMFLIAGMAGQLPAEDRMKMLEKSGTMAQPGAPLADQVREKKGLPSQTPQMVPIEKVKIAPPCPDLAATDISFVITNVWKLPSGPRSGDVKIIGTAKNIGKGNLTYSGKLVLYEGGKQVGAPTSFGNVPSGGVVTTESNRKWFPDDPLYKNSPPTYLLKIIYDPVADLKSKYDQDCKWDNNETQRSGKDINSQFPNP
jgi:hypothetical protein